MNRNVIATAGSRFLLRATKFDGTAHWIQPFRVEQDDGTLLVATCRARTPIFTSRGEYRSPYDSRIYCWRDRWYNVIRLSRPGCSTELWYCNITTPPTYDGLEVTYVDLDLDVSVRPNGCIELLDSDEFVQHRQLFGYPTEVIASAEAAVQQVAELARLQAFPFNEKV